MPYMPPLSPYFGAVATRPNSFCRAAPDISHTIERRHCSEAYHADAECPPFHEHYFFATNYYAIATIYMCLSLTPARHHFITRYAADVRHCRHIAYSSRAWSPSRQLNTPTPDEGSRPPPMRHAGRQGHARHYLRRTRHWRHRHADRRARYTTSI